MELPLVRTSERTTYTRCKQSWWWSYVEHLRPQVEAPPLRFGTLIHAALEARYPVGRKRGPHPAKTFEKLYQAELVEKEEFGFRDADGTWADARELGIAMMNNFVDFFGEDEEYEVLASEQRFKLRVRGTTGAPLCYAVGTFDNVLRHLPTGRTFINDWKTAKEIWDRYLILDEQATSYWLFAGPWLRKIGVLKKGEQLDGMLFTFLRKHAGDPRPQNEAGLYLNKDGSVSKVQPPPLFKRVMTYRTEADRLAALQRFRHQVEEAQMRRTGMLPVYKEPGRQACGMCSFRDMCELHEVGADWELYRDATMTTWDPYSDHEIEEEGKR